MCEKARATVSDEGRVNERGMRVMRTKLDIPACERHVLSAPVTSCGVCSQPLF